MKAAGFLSLIGSIVGCLAVANAAAPFTPVQLEFFSAPHALSNAFADFDVDGDLDLSLTEDFPDNNSRHPLFRNELPNEATRRSLQVLVLDREGRATRNGAEVRLFASDGKLLGTRLVPTGDGYGSQSTVPVHFGLASLGTVTVEVTFLTREGRKLKRLDGVDPRKWAGRILIVKEG